MTDTAKPKQTRRFARTPKDDASGGEAPANTPDTAGTAAAAEQPADDGPVAGKPAKPESKIARVIALLQRAGGATLEEMIAVTGWLPHTTRAALTGLKKKGHVITRGKRGDVTCYRISGAA